MGRFKNFFGKNKNTNDISEKKDDLIEDELHGIDINNAHKRAITLIP